MRRNVVTLLVCLAAAVGLGACGEDDEGSSSAAPAAAASSADDADQSAPAEAADDATTSEAQESDEPAEPAVTEIDGHEFEPAVIKKTRKAGKLQDSTFISGDKEARKNLTFKNTYCFWSDNKIWMTTTFTNGMDAHVTVHVQPNYRLEKAGLHGDGLTSQEDVGIDAGATREWVGELGKPEGVAEDKQPKITECSPEINDVELG